ncbi:VirK family protein [Achromobacter aloeverae]|nr:VirK family protein [Achromobacter aloeverae]
MEQQITVHPHPHPYPHMHAQGRPHGDRGPAAGKRGARRAAAGLAAMATALAAVPATPARAVMITPESGMQMLTAALVAVDAPAVAAAGATPAAPAWPEPGAAAASANLKAPEARPADARSTDGRSADARSTDARSTDVRPTDIRPTDGRSTDARSTDAKPADAKPTDARPTDPKGGHGLNSYQAVLGALMKGQPVTVTVDLATCRGEADGRAGPSVRGGMRIGSFLVTRDQTIAFSDTHETLHETTTGSGEYEAVTEYLRYRLTPDGIVKLHMAKRGSASDKPIKIKTTYRCQLGHGVNFLRASR